MAAVKRLLDLGGALRAALFSGGKESLYAAMKLWPPNLFIFLMYEPPQPSPHIANYRKALEAADHMEVPVATLVLSRGREREETVRAFERLGVSELVAGDVAVEDHLNYLQEICDEAGCALREPLWGLDTRELLFEEVEAGIRFVVVGGARGVFSNWLGKEVCPENVGAFAAHLEQNGVDFVGEYGEYHTLVVYAPVFSQRLSYRVVGVDEVGEVLLARVG